MENIKKFTLSNLSENKPKFMAHLNKNINNNHH